VEINIPLSKEMLYKQVYPTLVGWLQNLFEFKWITRSPTSWRSRGSDL